MDNIRNNFRNHKFTLKTTNLNFYANVMRKKFEFLAIKNPCECENISRITCYTQNYLFSSLILIIKNVGVLGFVRFDLSCVYCPSYSHLFEYPMSRHHVKV